MATAAELKEVKSLDPWLKLFEQNERIIEQRGWRKVYERLRGKGASPVLLARAFLLTSYISYTEYQQLLEQVRKSYAGRVAG